MCIYSQFRTLRKSITRAFIQTINPFKYIIIISTKINNLIIFFITVYTISSGKSKYTDNKVNFKTYLFIVGDNTFGGIIYIVWRWPGYDFCFIVSLIIIDTIVY